MTVLDILIVAAYFVATVVIGVYYLRQASQSVRSYFLGAENKWWMLAASEASTNFSINGTVWNLAILMVLGMKSFFVTWYGGCPTQSS